MARALAAGPAVLVFFDQDSKIGQGFLAALGAPLNPGTAKITSPLYVEDVSNVPCLLCGRAFRATDTAVHAADATKPNPVDIVISSGTAATSEVSGLRECSMRGCSSTASTANGVCVAAASNSDPCGSDSGDASPGGQSLDPACRFTILQHNPTRCYYQLRNCLLMSGNTFRSRLPATHALCLV